MLDATTYESTILEITNRLIGSDIAYATERRCVRACVRRLRRRLSSARILHRCPQRAVGGKCLCSRRLRVSGRSRDATSDRRRAPAGTTASCAARPVTPSCARRAPLVRAAAGRRASSARDSNCSTPPQWFCFVADTRLIARAPAAREAASFVEENGLCFCVCVFLSNQFFFQK